ncbi:MAG: response regulator [Saprospiraceae bacterium]
MKDTVVQLKELVSNNEMTKVLAKLQSIFALADSELATDAILLSARFNKLKSNIRRGILAQSEIDLVENKIAYAALSLIEELENDPEQFKQFDQVEEKIQHDSKEKTNMPLPNFLQDALVQRMGFIKQKKLSLKALWIDDNSGFQTYEKELLKTIGVHFDTAHSSEDARKIMNHSDYDFIISDISRGKNSKAGIDFLNSLIADEKETPVIFYAAALDFSLGTPPYSFGMTNLVSELLHLVMDIVERKY